MAVGTDISVILLLQTDDRQTKYSWVSKASFPIYMPAGSLCMYGPAGYKYA